MSFEENLETYLAVTNNGVDQEDLLECLKEETDKLREFCIEADHRRDWPQQIVLARLGELVYRKLSDELEAALTSPSLEPLVRSHHAAQLALSARETELEQANRELTSADITELMKELNGELKS